MNLSYRPAICSLHLVLYVFTLSHVDAQVGPTAGKNTAFDRYVRAPDNAYSWKLVSSKKESGATTFIIRFTSQRWRKPDEVDRTVWRHSLVVVRPDRVQSNTALLFIGGGRNGGPNPQSADARTKQIALATNSVVAELGMIPNQPLIFHGDGRPRMEDDLIAYAWDQFLKTGDATWLPRLPMVKAVVRAMDTLQALSRRPEFDQLPIEQFVVAGASKRGWTTWMTAAADQRVSAIVPIVIDVLNVKPSMDHHYAAYGFWAPAVKDYVNHKITHRRNQPEHLELLKLVDPFAYRARFTMPKCIINATGDEFFLPDSSKFYFDDLPGEKHLCYVPNSSHSLDGTNALETLIAFHFCVINGIPRPEFSWQFEGANSIRVQSETEPRRVLLWQATNPDARDFRLDTIGKTYQNLPMLPEENGEFVATVERTATGWTAYFVQLEFDVGAPVPLRLTTPVRVIPDDLPYADKEAAVVDSR